MKNESWRETYFNWYSFWAVILIVAGVLVTLSSNYYLNNVQKTYNTLYQDNIDQIKDTRKEFKEQIMDNKPDNDEAALKAWEELSLDLLNEHFKMVQIESNHFFNNLTAVALMVTYISLAIGLVWQGANSRESKRQTRFFSSLQSKRFISESEFIQLSSKAKDFVGAFRYTMQDSKQYLFHKQKVQTLLKDDAIIEHFISNLVENEDDALNLLKDFEDITWYSADVKSNNEEDLKKLETTTVTAELNGIKLAASATSKARAACLMYFLSLNRA